uniref:Uncharacterized protein n=1 Tax=Anguilla anguilla TaxID=7936 RepID=A0A0E9QAQ0_ANGAN
MISQILTYNTAQYLYCLFFYSFCVQRRIF